MIFMWTNASNFEEDEEEEGGDLNDALLDELDPEDLDDEELIEGEVPVVPPAELDEEEGEDATAKAFFEDEPTGDDADDEDEGDYDSFDDKDEL
jgi:hypothetical protein